MTWPWFGCAAIDTRYQCKAMATRVRDLRAPVFGFRRRPLPAWLWKGSPFLGLVIGLALALNTVIAVSIGGLVPLLLARLGQDPAIASGPLLTTITDMAGFFLVLSLATIMMPLLVR